MRRTTVLICLTTLIVSVLLSRFGLAADWNIVTYDNNARAVGDKNSQLYSVLENINLVNGDRLLFNDNLDNTYYGVNAERKMNGVDNARGILIKNGSIQFLNGMGDKQRDRVISSTPSNSYGLLNVTWFYDAGNITVGHLRVSDLGINNNTSFTFSNGLRASSNALPQYIGNVELGRANYDDTTVEGYTGAGADDIKVGVDGGGALRVVGFNGNVIPGISGAADINIAGIFTPGANFGTTTTFAGNKATGELRNNNTYGGYGGAVFVKDVGDAINDPRNYNSVVSFEKRATFTSNQATYDGGAIYVTENGMVWFLNNTSYTNFLDAGYIQNAYEHNARTTYYGASFVKNTAGNSGGALAISSNGYVAIEGGSIYEDNKALGTSALPTGGYEFKGEGGAILVRDDAQLYIYDGASFRNNTAAVAGGAISIRNNALVRITGAVAMFGNHATGTESVLHRNGPQITLADNISRSDPYIGPTQLYPVRPAAGYGGAVYIDNGTLTMFDAYGSIGLNTTGAYVPNTHGNTAEKTANGIYMNTNATWNIQPGRNHSLNIYDPITSRGLEQIAGPDNEDWSLREHNNVINIDGHYNGRVNIWNDSSDSAFLPLDRIAMTSSYDTIYGGRNSTYIDGSDIYSVDYFNVHYETAGPSEMQVPIFTWPEDGGPPTIEWETVTVVGHGNRSFSVQSQFVSADAVATSTVVGPDNVLMRLVRLQNSITLESVDPNIVTPKMQGENIVAYELLVEGNTLTIAPNAVVALGMDGEAVSDENPLVNYNITLDRYYVPATGLTSIKGDIAAGYYGDLNILNGIFTLKNGANVPAGMEVKPTEFGSNRYLAVWRQTENTITNIDQANSGSLTIGHGDTFSDNVATNPDGSLVNNLEDIIGSAGLVANPQMQATLWLEKYTGPGGGYTTFRTNNITMNGGRIAMTGIDEHGNISPTIGDDTAKIYTYTDGIYLQAPDPYTGTGYGGTFDIGDQQEFSLYHYLYGDGSFTKAGNGLLIFANIENVNWLTQPYFPYGDIFAHQSWRPDSENDIELIGFAPLEYGGGYYYYDNVGIIYRSAPHQYFGLTVISGGTLQMSQNNVLAMVRTYGFCDPDAPDPGANNPHPEGDYWHSYRTNTAWWRANQPNDIWYAAADSDTTGAGGLTIKRDYRNRLIFEGISRGVVLTGQTGDMNSAGYKAVLDLSHTEPLTVLNDIHTDYIYDDDGYYIGYDVILDVNRRDEYIDDPLHPGQLIKNPRYIEQTKEQTFKALSGAVGTSILMGSDIVLTISDGWMNSVSDGVTDLLDPINKDYINGYFLDTEFYEGSLFDRYFNGQIKGGGKLIKRGMGYLGLSGANELDKSTELQGGGLYIGNVDALGGKYVENAGEVGLVEVHGDENKVFGIRNDKDYTLTLRFVADANYYPEDPNRTDYSVYGVYEDETTGVIDHNIRPVWLERPAGDLTFDANGRILTITGVISSHNGGAIEMQAGNAARPWEYGANLYFDDSTEGSGYVFSGNTSDGLGGAIYAGGNLTIVGNTLFDNNASAMLTGAVHVAGSNLNASTARTQVLFDTTNGGDIVFKSNNIYSISFEKNTDFNITGSGNIYLDAPLKITGDYDDNGDLIATQNATGNGVSLTKGGAGFLQLQGTNEFNGEIAINSGMLRLAGMNASLGNSTNFTVQATYDDAGKVLSEGGIAGNGRIVAEKMTLLGRISPDSTTFVAPQNNLGNLISTNGIAPVVPVKDRVGTLTLESPEITFSGVFNVDLGYSTLERKHTNDRLQIDGKLTMSNDVQLAIDYGQMNIVDVYKRGVTYTIIESNDSIIGNKVRDSHITHTYNGVARTLPRFVTMLSHGFTNNNQEYYLRYGSSGWTFADASRTSNQRGVANAFNNMLEGLDTLPEKFRNLLIEIGSQDDNGVSNALDNMTTDISAHSLALAQSEAWSSPFKRMRHREPGYRPQVGYLGQSRIPFKVRPRETWIDFSYSSMQTYGDSNARTYNTSRTGFTIGLEKELLDNFSVGAVFGYAAPQLTQSNGKIEANDFQLGAYALVYLPFNTEWRTYVGWSMLDYDYTRHERFTLSGLAAISKYTADYSGQNLGFSTELSRPFRWSGWLLLEPIIGIDHQTSHQNAFSEVGGLYNQRFNQADYSRTITRFGLRSQLGNSEEFTFNTRIQYGTTLQDSAPVSVSHWEDLTGSPDMEMQGIMLGNSYINLGAGIKIFLNERGTARISFDYDAYITERSVVNTGNVNFGFQW